MPKFELLDDSEDENNGTEETSDDEYFCLT